MTKEIVDTEKSGNRRCIAVTEERAVTVKTTVSEQSNDREREERVVIEETAVI